MSGDYGLLGWERLPADTASRAWAAAALGAARAALAAPENAGWYRHGGTWFAGVNLLDTAPTGALAGTPLAGPALARLAALGALPAAWDRAQVSAVFPGYPRHDPAAETEAAFRYRRLRAAAHVDGLLPTGPERRRHLGEAHAFILGLPLTEAPDGAGALTVWEGSHRLMARAFARALAPHPPAAWGGVDLTGPYHAARRAAFDRCPRRELSARPGEALLLHRHTLHGIGPWPEGAPGPAGGRLIAYFRPEMPLERWLGAP